MGTLPKWATGRIMVALVSLGTLIDKVPSKLRKAHLENNEANWDSYKAAYPTDRFIEHQRYLDKLLFGKRTSYSERFIGSWTDGDSIKASANSCEVISVHSAMIAIRGQEVETFPRLLALFEKNGAVLGANAGSSFEHMKKHLKEYGFSPKLYIVKKLKDSDYKELMTEYNTYILSIWNGNTMGEGLHSMCITCENGQYILHNAYGHGRVTDNLKDTIYSYSANPITLIAVK